jgi:hypothetical protein
MNKVVFLFVALFATLAVFGQTASIQDQQACEYARRNKSAEIWRDYLKQFPNGICSFEAKSEVKKLQSKTNRIGNLYWSDRSPQEMNWESAQSYCQNLTEGGFSDWRLPTISELKTTIQNCQSGGSSCGVSDRCLSPSCGGTKGCSCDSKFNNGGYYSKLGDDDNVWLWSSSLCTLNKKAWRVGFSGAIISSFGGNFNGCHVRCVR